MDGTGEDLMEASVSTEDRKITEPASLTVAGACVASGALGIRIRLARMVA